MALTITELQAWVYDHFLAAGNWPPVHRVQVRYLVDGDIRTIAARFGKHQVVCQAGSTGHCYLPLGAIATLPHPDEDLANVCKAVQFASSWCAEKGPEAMRHLDLPRP